LLFVGNFLSIIIRLLLDWSTG